MADVEKDDSGNDAINLDENEPIVSVTLTRVDNGYKVTAKHREAVAMELADALKLVKDWLSELIEKDDEESTDNDADAER